MKELTKEQLEFEEDEILDAECEECGHHMEGLDEEPEECEECGSTEIIPTTRHENTECERCGHYFDPWEDAYVDKDNLTDFYCEDCYEELPAK